MIPPYTDAHHAFTTITSAATADNADTVDRLPAIEPWERDTQAKRAVAQ